MILSRSSIARVLESLRRQAGPTEQGWRVQAKRAANLFGLEHGPALRGLCGSSVSLAAFVHASWDQQSLVFSTSGSTGAAKAYRQEMYWLTQESRFLAGLFADRKRVVSLVPAHHIYGFLFTVLLPIILETPTEEIDPLTIGVVAQRLAPGDLVVGFPLMWKKLGELGTRFPRNVIGISSTGPCDHRIISSALRNGLDQMVEIHGSTETGGIGYRTTQKNAYQLMDHWRTSPLPDELERANPRGGWVRFQLPDSICWEGERLYRPSGRKDMAVQVAGVNVYPQLVKDILLSHPSVADAAVRPMRPEEGDRLKAFIVPAYPSAAVQKMLRSLQQHLASHLHAAEIPRLFTFGQAVPKSELGKETDWDHSETDSYLI